MAWISGILGLLGMMDQRNQNKAAQSNNAGQQAGMLNNANSAWTDSLSGLQKFQQNNPGPFANITSMTGPQAGGYGLAAPRPMPGMNLAGLGAAGGAGAAPGAPGGNPQQDMIQRIIAAILQQQQGGGPNPPTPTAAPPTLGMHPMQPGQAPQMRTGPEQIRNPQPVNPYASNPMYRNPSSAFANRIMAA